MGDGWFAFGIYEDLTVSVESEPEEVAAMSQGPIDFGDEEIHETGYSTEFGGVDGLIQPETPAGGDAASGHALTPSEISQIAGRRATVPLSSRAAKTGEPDDVLIIDPVTGREVDVADLKDVTDEPTHVGELSDMKPE
jgi:hypothetical protein